jgi:antirestriction protein ArdC
MPSVYEIIISKIIEQLESGVVPWRMTATDAAPARQ